MRDSAGGCSVEPMPMPFVKKTDLFGDIVQAIASWNFYFPRHDSHEGSLRPPKNSFRKTCGHWPSSFGPVGIHRPRHKPVAGGRCLRKKPKHFPAKVAEMNAGVKEKNIMLDWAIGLWYGVGKPNVDMFFSPPPDHTELPEMMLWLNDRRGVSDSTMSLYVTSV